MLEISSSKNPTIKEIKSLSRKKNRWKEKLFILEGIKVIEEAIESSFKIKYILFTDKLALVEGGSEFFEEIKGRTETIKVSKEVFKDITDLENPQGVIAVVEFKDLDLEILYKKENPSIIFLDALNDPGNLGTIIRTADAFKIDAIVLGENSVDPYNPKVVRATMASILRVPIYNVEDNKTFFHNMKKNDINIITTSLKGKPLDKDEFINAFVVVIGNEASGVGEALLKESDKQIKIPMPGGAESLNAGVAASIIMYEAMKSRM